MVLYKNVQLLVSKYSFIDAVDFKRAKFFIYYRKNGVTKYKTLPYRADKNMLIKLINSIKKDIDFKKQQQELKEKVKQKMKREPLIGV